MSTAMTDHLDSNTFIQLLEVSRKLAGPSTLKELLGLVIDVGRSVLDTDRGTVFLYDPSTQELFTTVATGVKKIRIGINIDSIVGTCALDRRIVNVPDCYADPRFNREVDRETGYRTDCLIAVPLVGLDDELVGVMQLLNPKKGCFDAFDEQIAETLASQAAVAIQRARLMDDRMAKLKLEADLDIARQIQLEVLPKQLPVCQGYDLADYSKPAEQTGGDIYDVVALDGATGTSVDSSDLLLLLADATGHGIGPALSVTQVRAMLRIALRYSKDLETLVRHINSQLTVDLASDRFITAFVGVLDPRHHRVRYFSYGQGPLLLYQAATGQSHWFNASSPPFGIIDDPPKRIPEPIDLAPGDIFILLTDGFYEYQNEQDEQFGPERVAQVVGSHCEQSAMDIIQHLLDGVQRFAGSAAQTDDLTALVLKRESEVIL